MPLSVFRKSLELAGAAAMISICVLMGAIVIPRIFPTKPAPPKGYAAGEAMELLPGVSYGISPKTMILHIRQGCHFCAESLGLYRALSTVAARRSSNCRLLVVTSDDVTSARDYLRAHEIEAADIVHLGACPSNQRTRS